jgi:hypothetical protein
MMASRKERVQDYCSMLISSPGLVRIRDESASEIKTVKDFAAGCLAAARWLDEEFEKMGMEDL